eukprot:3830847-Prymnesium_polylepis.1
MASRPSSKRSRASTSCESASTSDERNWQSPLKSPHTRATQGSHPLSRRAAVGAVVPRSLSCCGRAPGPLPSMRRRPDERKT